MNSEDQPSKVPDCQLQVLPDAAHSLIISDRIRILIRRLLQTVERQLGRSRQVPGSIIPPKIYTQSCSTESQDKNIAEGDWVEVLPLEGIHATLDTGLRCEGLEFMPRMEAYCGRQFQVKKRVRAIFDERAWRMLSIKNTFLLDGVFCDGRGMYAKEGCDRLCYFFWKDKWLKKCVRD